jgi:hypothetical protein
VQITEILAFPDNAVWRIRVNFESLKGMCIGLLWRKNEHNAA